MIGSGQHVWVRMWGPNDEIIADGVLMPGEDIHLVFSDGPELVSRWALTRITRAEAERLAEEKGVKQEIAAPIYRIPGLAAGHDVP